MSSAYGCLRSPRALPRVKLVRREFVGSSVPAKVLRKLGRSQNTADSAAMVQLHVRK